MGVMRYWADCSTTGMYVVSATQRLIQAGHALAPDVHLGDREHSRVTTTGFSSCQSATTVG
jgi:hypothetical protein